MIEINKRLRLRLASPQVTFSAFFVGKLIGNMLKS